MQTSWTASWWFKYAIEGAQSSERIMCAGGSAYFSIFASSTPSHRLFWTPTFSPANFGPSLRDPSAWYHVVLQSTATASTVFLNGEQVGRSGSAGTTNLFNTIGSNTNPNNFEGLMADWFVIDGQALEPTAFGRENDNGVWVPREVDFTPAQMRLSDFVTGDFDPTGTTTPLPALAFDGSTDTRFFGLPGGTCQFAPEPAIEFTGFRVFGAGNANSFYTFDGTTKTGTSTSGAWIDFSGISGQFDATTPLIFGASNGSNRPELNAIEITDANGTRILTNPFIWSASLFTAPSSATIPTAGTNRDFFSTRPATRAFDGNEATDAVGDEGVASWMMWFPTQDITARTSLRVRTAVVQTIAVNGTDTTLNQTSPTVNWVDLSPQLTFPLDLDAIQLRGTGTNNPTLNAVEIDGQILVDGVNNSYGANGFHLDFSDPDDIGADRSGNENDFTATGFNTDLVGIFSNFLTSATGFQPTLPAVDAFDNNTGTQAGTNGTGATLVFAPDPPLENITELAIFSGMQAGGTLKWNGNTVSTVRNAWTIITDTADLGPANTMELTSTAASTCTLVQVRINGDTILVNNTGTDYDLMQDSPTQNYATLNPLPPVSGTMTRANLTLTGPTGSNWSCKESTLYVSGGRVYWEIQCVTRVQTILGIGRTDFDANNSSTFPGQANNGQSIGLDDDGMLRSDGTNTANWSAAYNPGDILSFALDLNAGALWIGINGTWQNGATQAEIEAGTTTNAARTGITGTWRPVNSATTGAFDANYGQKPFAHAAPANFKRLQTQNLPAATIRNGRDHFQAITGPGQGTTTNPYDPDTQTAGDFTQYVYGSTSSQYKPGTVEKTFFPDFPPSNVFDGSEDTACVAGAGETANWIYFRPATPLTDVTSVTVRTNFIQEVRINGIVTGDTAGTSPEDMVITDPPSTITEIALQSTGAAAVQMNNIVVNGKTLVDVGILSVAQGTFDSALYWIKSRVTDANTNQHQLVDSVRGGNLALQCPGAGAETAYVAPAGDSVAWCWKAGGAAVANEDGSIASQVSANTDAGFSIATYDGQNTAGTVGHGLTRAPEFIIIKRRNAADDWLCYHVSTGNNAFLTLNDTRAAASPTGVWDTTNPGTQTFRLGGGFDETNTNGGTYVAYCWHSVPGYSAFGSYQANGNADGPAVNLGFKPALIILKSPTNPFDWQIYDSTRSPTNPALLTLSPNQTASEVTSGNDLDILSNGFKPRDNGSINNNSGATYLYMAWAENPFGASNTSPANAR
jgi:hypothetical protein